MAAVLFGGIYVSGTPIWTRIRRKSILGHPFQKKVLKYVRILLGKNVVGSCMGCSQGDGDELRDGGHAATMIRGFGCMHVASWGHTQSDRQI